MDPKRDLPLLYFTPPEWTAAAMADPLALLDNHAHLEKNAATNALGLLLCWPAPDPPESWVETMTSIANDEVSHLHIVSRILLRRGGRLSRVLPNPYAGALRKFTRYGRAGEELVDRLMISALIEARSCERFQLLATGCEDPELAKLYEGLYRSEAGHYELFIDIARRVPKAGDVEGRWHFFLTEEARIIQEQPPGPTMHSGPPRGVLQSGPGTRKMDGQKFGAEPRVDLESIGASAPAPRHASGRIERETEDL